ncbi:hypothetical protein C7S10_13610 [Nocardioides currus]|uniref:Fenitrothion hydrolase n=2 Tax=Nocardioides currus TaxID=2133958 RepID=A0A2R7YWN8_9ACTN|nr:hypothetical protein C7S10_13610 [Nocardioides currus]
MPSPLAHGLGGGSDLPIPASFAIAGGTAALVLSFTILVLAWRGAKFVNVEGGRAAPSWLTAALDSRALTVVARGSGLALLAYVGWAAICGQDLLSNPTFGVVYVWLWIGIVPTSLLLGPFFKAVSPARTLHLGLARLAGLDPTEGLFRLPPRLGYWPAATGLLAFVWLELVYPGNQYLGPVRLWFALYFATTVIGALLFGSRWLERADPFEVYSTLVGRLSVWGRTSTGGLVLRTPLRNLAGIPAEPGLVAVVSVLLGSTAFDSFRASNSWLRFSQTTTASVPLLETTLLLVACGVVAVTFTLATMSVGDDTGLSRRRHPAAMAHSIVPIIVGYMVAHYLTFFVETGQETLALMSDPLTDGSDLLGTADLRVNYWLSLHPTFLATTKVLAIVIGHVVGVVAAHDRSLQLLPAKRQLSGQLPLLAAMTLYTFAGLYLLFGV